MIQSLSTFVVAALLEIAGCFAFWMWLRRGAHAGWVFVGAIALVGFAVALARVDTSFAGRAYAAYGGIYIACALGWLWLAEGQRPTSTDIVGAAAAVVGALIILSPALRR